MIRLSIVIPVYNTAKYLPDCLQSILIQFDGKNTDRRNEIELILVDDGSSDESLLVCKDFKASNPNFNISILTGPNQGVSVTRNKGLDMAKGEYIFFMDSDDMILPDSLLYILDSFATEKPDYIGFWYEIVDLRKNPDARPVCACNRGEIYASVSGIDLVKSGNFQGTVCVSLFKRSFLELHRLSFDKNLVVGEDFRFCLEFFLKNPRCVLTNVRPYLYFYRSGSSATSSNPEKTQRWIKGYITNIKYLEQIKKAKPELADGVDKCIKRELSMLIPKLLMFRLSYSQMRNLAKDDTLRRIKNFSYSDGLVSYIGKLIFSFPVLYRPLSAVYNLSEK